MSWVLKVKDGATRVVAYEALLKSLFATARATGLCLYDQQRMPFPVINGAIVTHPHAYMTHNRAMRNRFYDPGAVALPAVSDRDVITKVRELTRAVRRSSRRGVDCD